MKKLRRTAPVIPDDKTSFERVIYLSRKQLVSIQTSKEYRCWPRGVWVMDDSFDIDGPLWCHPVNHEPCSLYAWAEFHFREQYAATLTEIHHALKVWWGLHEQITTYMVLNRTFHPSKRRLIYNTTWALLGYEVNQPQEVLDLAHKVFFDPLFQNCGLRSKYPDQPPAKDISRGKKGPAAKPKCRTKDTPNRSSPKRPVASRRN